MTEGWYVCTHWFFGGPKWMSGPYSTRNDAATAQRAFEQIEERPGAYWIESESVPVFQSEPKERP